MRKTRLKLLIVDDQPEQTALKRALESSSSVCVTVRHPNEVEDSDLKDLHLLLVDYELDDWVERDNAMTASLRPVDGLALSAIYRRKLQQTARPTAIAIHTGKMADLANPLPPEHREHALARLNNLEWVFPKANLRTRDNLVHQIYSLAAAIDLLPLEWGLSPHHPLDSLIALLGIKKTDAETTQVIEDILGCLPPIYELSQWSHGLAVLRWLLHRVLPYPTFLWDTHRLACRLKMDIRDLNDLLIQDKPLQKLFSPCEYRGVLSEFLGPRWWRSKIESSLWRHTHGRSSDPEAVWGLIQQLTRRKLTKLFPSESLVVCIDRHYQPINELFPMDRAVRVRPDDWPSYADQAWTTPELVQSEATLRAIMCKEDQAKLKKSA